MKKGILLLIALAALPAPAYAGEVVVELTGIQPGQGDLFVGVQTKDEFLTRDGSYGTRVAAPQGEGQRIVIPDVPPGEYSVAVWHDTDGDGKFTLSPDGLPLDGWSMAGAQKFRGTPQWDQAKVAVGPDQTVIGLSMVYPRPHH